uniref:Receptor L-domain domain-containing protein n=1 Tax=Chromera velia CCMP2878 TaxID=1169474 RepID=A0A0G4F1P1_9ALVE|mmetsp:Transcript_36970/g.72700  ORF Transcript_36970/g.72700 Transcript_36970/m.72700 type:complete len:368 (+) Transcript_36970:225-1328(+)|eukprot:Cvel_14647.t1-p1 / transcript=Cvel_14647.t1 / gene=Cvel_14647 / organism=Chromera_velia_CCMP2878 / gene_product=hypothetical protein / transcript_product=hypothetical protein / location=Cvel_scaffold1049:2253-7292(+) / protein_length=367 / sequence_SO=supercontig / SO=protein_coding / is_pseudo=false
MFFLHIRVSVFLLSLLFPALANAFNLSSLFSDDFGSKLMKGEGSFGFGDFKFDSLVPNFGETFKMEGLNLHKLNLFQTKKEDSKGKDKKKKEAKPPVSDCPEDIDIESLPLFRVQFSRIDCDSNGADVVQTLADYRAFKANLTGSPLHRTFFGGGLFAVGTPGNLCEADEFSNIVETNGGSILQINNPGYSFDNLQQSIDNVGLGGPSFTGAVDLNDVVPCLRVVDSFIDDVFELRRFSVFGTSATNLTGPNRLVSVGAIQIQNNNNLQGVDGFEAVTFETVAPPRRAVVFEGNSVLTTISGFSSVPDDLFIEDDEKVSVCNNAATLEVVGSDNFKTFLEINSVNDCDDQQACFNPDGNCACGGACP